MAEITPQLSQRFKNMALLCSFFVVMIHCVSNFGIDNWLVHNALYDGVCRMAVPFFFFTSGFFLYGHVGEKGWWSREVKKRVRSLLLPYIVLIMLYWGYSTLTVMLGNFVNGRQISCNVITSIVDALGLNPLCHPVLMPLWYIRALFILVLLSPLFAHFRHKLGVGVLIIAFALYGILGPWEGMGGSIHYIFRKTLATQGLFYMCLGMAFRGEVVNMVLKHKAIAWILLVVGLLLMGFKVYLHCNGSVLYYYVGWISVPCILIGLFNVMTSQHLPDWLTSCAFPIYLMHMFVLRTFIVLFSAIRFSVKEHLLIWTIIVLVVFVLTLMIVAGQRKYFKVLNVVLWGGR